MSLMMFYIIISQILLCKKHAKTFKVIPKKLRMKLGKRISFEYIYWGQNLP